MRFAGRIAIVTGAARGLGAAIARRLALEGATVFATDVLDGEEAATEMRRSGLDVRFQHLDVTQPAEWQALTNGIGDKLHILVNNAGLIVRKGLDATTLAEWNLVPAVIDSAVDVRIDCSARTEMRRDRETECREEVCGGGERCRT